MLSRINDVLNEHTRMMLPIEGYQNMRLLSLEEAVEPLVPLFGRKDLLSKVWVVKERCKTPADGLSQDESASIMLYTLDWFPAENSLYLVLNKTLRLEERNQLKPWFSYLRLFLSALSQLPPINDTIYRGINQDLSVNYSLGSNSIWWGVTSCTDTINVLESANLCGTSGVRTIFSIKCLDGRSIKNHSYYHVENEVILMPGRYLRVHSNYKANDGLHIIQLVEMKPPYELLKLPDNNLWRRISPGISLLGTCINAACAAYQKEVIIHIGFRTFDVLLDTNSSTAKCTICEHYVEIAKLGFSQCHWCSRGIKQIAPSQPPIPFSEDWSYAHGKSLFEYNLQNGITWRQLIIEAKP
jgi:hypothetical protein